MFNKIKTFFDLSKTFYNAIMAEPPPLSKITKDIINIIENYSIQDSFSGGRPVLSFELNNCWIEISSNWIKFDESVSITIWSDGCDITDFFNNTEKEFLTKKCKERYLREDMKRKQIDLDKSIKAFEKLNATFINQY